MTITIEKLPPNGHELGFTCLVDAPPSSVYRCWTDPQLLTRWFAPAPWTTSRAELDVRPGGANLVVMRSPEGEEYPNQGTYLEVVPNEKLVLTDAFTGNWEPSAKPFMTAILTFVNEGGQTRYTARVRHWNTEDKETHEKMGFFEGWGAATNQLESVAKSLAS
ncbi:MAG TPA: polyketide cyclase [Rhizobium sp.]|nr:polyketide cyclase [Rhizobium sp.]